MECLAKTDSTKIGKIDELRNTTTLTSGIKLEWSTKCEDRFILKNYTVTFCTVKDHGHNECIESIDPFTTNQTTYSFHNLKPKQHYKISITMNSATNKGPSRIDFFKTKAPGK